MSDTTIQEQVENMGSTHWPKRREAYAALRKAGTNATDSLLKGLDHPNPLIRKSCAALLDHVADARCAAPLARALKDPIMDVRRHALHALVCDHCKTVPLDIDTVGLVTECAFEFAAKRQLSSAFCLQTIPVCTQPSKNCGPIPILNFPAVQTGHWAGLLTDAKANRPFLDSLHPIG